MMTIINGFVPYQGEHCETTTMGNLMQFAGIRISEPMLFGLGQGLGFIYWDSKGMGFPFIGGRVKVDELTTNLADRLGLTVKVQETSSVDKAWRNVQSYIERGIPVGLKLDSYYLDYFTNKVHFAGHYAAIYGMDDEYAYMADTRQQGGLVKTRLTNLAAARNAKGPMSSRNRSFTLEPIDALPPLIPAIHAALTKNAHDYLNPPIRNIGNKGIVKMSHEILQWPSRSNNFEHDLCLTALLMERAGTGGALFRNLYRDFLKECIERFEDPKIEQAYLLFTVIAPMWVSVSASIDRAGRTGNHQELRQASNLLLEIADKERAAIELLL
ncbi:BtrH N-terminal domain-containing protein [Paenibacillus chitinolyticus]|uniref:BtrH N-terminal domain-containing protein n=1 Tax=Paenibacillus chitinolyticus TaxID=79263 RepID=UPI002DBA8A1C|nr:BtrH N-terminal domain-containing protein [Paenibacillus chitinolyticus]MEC0247677.1 BtrH N-terminal domain-containing protein [Paenibacillus chitinolyticus]